MRQLTLTIPLEGRDRMLETAERHDISLFAEIDTVSASRNAHLFIFNAPNAAIEGFLSDIEAIDHVRVTFAPQGVIALRPPADAPEDAMIDIQPRSPIEIFLSGLQSIGTWKGFLGYAAVGGVVVWIGLFTESVFLLVAAMLIAPFAGPAMAAALATARGDARLLGRSLLRYVAALATTIGAAFFLSILFDQRIATGLMVDASMRSTVSFLLPLAAGIAGALNLAQSERSSLVSGAATGMLVAAALAPPAGLVGMGLAIGEFDIVVSSLWALAIQIVGINLGGFAVFRLFGVSYRGARYPRGKRSVTAIALCLSVVAGGALLAGQFSTAPQLQQSSISQRVAAIVEKQIDRYPGVTLLKASAQFSRVGSASDNPLLVTVYLQGKISLAERKNITRMLKEKIHRDFPIDVFVHTIIF